MAFRAAVIVCEKSGRWAAGLRRALQGDRIRIRETRRLVDCNAELAAAPASLVLVEWSGERRAELALFIEHLARRFPLARVVVAADRDAAPEEGLAREAGAIHFISSPRAIGSVARLVRRHAARDLPAGDDPIQRLRQTLSG